MGTIYRLTPLCYIREGQRLRDESKLQQPHDDTTLAEAFIAYAEFMEGHFIEVETANKRGVINVDQRSVPMQLESFRLFAGIKREEWDKMTTDPECSRAVSLILDAIYCQQMEGALLGVYTARMVQLIQDRKDQLELSGTMAFEQIIGMEVN